jgi:integrase
MRRGEVNFYLKKAEPLSGKSLIYLCFKYSNNRFVYSFGQSVSPSQWNRKLQQVRNNLQTTKDGTIYINSLLNKLKEAVNQVYYRNLSESIIPDKCIIKKELDKLLNRQIQADVSSRFYKLLNRFISGEIQNGGQQKSVNTLKTYRTLFGHLKAFETIYNYRIDYDTLDLKFLYMYISFLRTSHDVSKIQEENIRKTVESLPLKQNSIAKDVQIIKTVLREAYDNQESNNVWFEHKKFTARREQTYSVYLTTSELLSLFNFKFIDKRLEEIKDLFLLGCFTGLRYSDYSCIKAEQIVCNKNSTTGIFEYNIHIIQTKTKEPIYIPCHPIVEELFGKYNANENRLPKSISNQKFNERIKEICRIAGLTQKGRLLSNQTVELWECITSHTARRSFATNLYLEGVPTYDIMKITGHKTEKSFLRYLKLNNEDAANRVRIHIGKTWGQSANTVQLND